ncbi:hypothetical protein IH992_07955 [Candidatus Poribacteria bacterium]|nr:hypothetical protein [Candidatus Poribacteria bacterium]
MPEINLFDRVLKILARHYAEVFLRLAFPDGGVQLMNLNWTDSPSVF